eukprot:scaffold43629_cov31-Prasinocladus_malaysianus.AAC.1
MCLSPIKLISPKRLMLWIQVWHAKEVIVMKRSLRPGYAGVDNPLFVRDNTDMFLGDAKVMSEKLFARIQEKMG